MQFKKNELFFTAMISVMDRGVGEVVQAIKQKGIMENTIIVFYSDNGAPTLGIHSTKGSNYPLKGVSFIKIKLLNLN